MGEDALQKLEAALRPVEKYAVRFLEEVSYPLRTVVAQAQATLQHHAGLRMSLHTSCRSIHT